MRRWMRAGAVAGLLLLASCLFSTTPPRRDTPDDGSPDPGVAVITGLVRHRDIYGSLTNMPGRTVAVSWFDGSHTTPIYTTQVTSGNGGVYTASYRDPGIHAVEVKAIACDFDPSDPNSCCGDVPPPPGCVCWSTPQRVEVAPGMHVQKDLVVQCH